MTAFQRQMLHLGSIWRCGEQRLAGVPPVVATGCRVPPLGATWRETPRPHWLLRRRLAFKRSATQHISVR